jgi:prefoldin subunit 5
MDMTVIVLLLAAGAAALLLVLLLRLAKRHDETVARLDRLEKAQKTGAQDTHARLEEATRTVEDLDGELRPHLKALSPRVDEFDSRFESLAARLGELDQRIASGGIGLQEVRTGIESVASLAGQAQERLGELGQQVESAGGRARRAEEGLEHAKGALGERLGALEGELRLVERRLEEAAAAPREVIRVAATTRPTIDPGTMKRPEASAPAPAVAAPEVPEVPEVLEAPAPVRVETEDFMFEGEMEEPVAPGAKGLVLLVAALAGLTILFHLLGVGR